LPRKSRLRLLGRSLVRPPSRRKSPPKPPRRSLEDLASGKALVIAVSLHLIDFDLPPWSETKTILHLPAAAQLTIGGFMPIY